MNAKEIADVAISRMNKRITNEIFMIIQNDRDLMKEYLNAVSTAGRENKDWDKSVNTVIGKRIKEVYGLINVDDREDNPLCTLIKSHQKFE
jgi:hypothetical protein